MAGLKTLLDGLAGEAPPYDVVDRAERSIRRRRRMVRLAPVAAGVAVVLVLGLGWTVLRDANPRPVVRPGTPASWLPPQLTIVADPPPLPSDRGIGPAALLYFPSGEDVATGRWRIVTSDGQQYGIAATMDLRGSEFLASASLSPDGRWLAVHRREHLVLRDLTGTGERTVSTYSNRSSTGFWSPDSRKIALVHATADDRADLQVRVIDVMTGAQSPAASLAALRQAWPLGVDNAGDLVLRSETPIAGSPSSQLTLSFVDPVTGREGRHVVVDPRTFPGSAAPAVQGDQALVLGASLLAANSLLVLANSQVTDYRALLVVDLNTGTLTEQHPLDNSGGGPVSASPETILLIRVGASGGPESTIAALDQLDRKTGEKRVVTTITGNIRLLLIRGTALGMF